MSLGCPLVVYSHCDALWLPCRGTLRLLGLKAAHCCCRQRQRQWHFCPAGGPARPGPLLHFWCRRGRLTLTPTRCVHALTHGSIQERCFNNLGQDASSCMCAPCSPSGMRGCASCSPTSPTTPTWPRQVSNALCSAPNVMHTAMHALLAMPLLELRLCTSVAEHCS